jgi:hypothetical protein
MARAHVTATLAFAGLAAATFATGSYALGGMALAAAVLSLRKSIASQSIARAAVWATFLPNAFVTLLLLPMGHAPPLRVVLEMALALAALVVARPVLSTERARAEFAPVALRPWFLASAIGTMATGVVLGLLARSFAHFHELRHDAIGLAALAVPLFVAGIGVLRMRAWGVVLGALAALASIPLVAWMHDSLLTVPVLLAATPAASLGVLVAIARLRSAPVVRPRVAQNVRVAAQEEVADFDFVSTDAQTSQMPSSTACTRR